jgi:hypothetical protein
MKRLGWLRELHARGALILMGDARLGKSLTILYGCLGRYSGIHRSRYLGILCPCLFPFRSDSCLITLGRVFGVQSRALYYRHIVPCIRPIGKWWFLALQLRPNGSIERHKASLALQGFSQQYGSVYVGVWAPTGELPAYHVMLTSICSPTQLFRAPAGC